MEPSTQKKRWLAGAIWENPLLVQALGLTAVIVGAVNLRAALWLSLLLSVHLMICEALAAAAKRVVPEWLRIALYFLVGLALVCPAAFLFERSPVTSEAALRLFLPLAALSGFAPARCERFAVRHSVAEALQDAVANALGFSVVAVLTGALRELLGSGMIWGSAVTNVYTRGLLMPFGGFLILGTLAAGLKVLLRTLGVRQGGQAEEPMGLAPEDRMERLEKVRLLMEAPEPEPEPEPEPDAEPEFEPEPEEFVPPKPIPVEQILSGAAGFDDLDGLDDFESLGETGQALTPVEKARLLEELESLLDDFAGPLE
ncbi:MAG: hypothetical protein LBG83_06100 [Oscillospiraceae bacterium]|jgi:electron transport complex protein RnfE|nr:hypothetical protein [Oscillospiraceae bacterium]